MTWLEFKNINTSWDFNFNFDSQHKLQLYGKFSKVWLEIGDQICKLYNMKHIDLGSFKIDKYKTL